MPIWRLRAIAHYLYAQGGRFGIADPDVERARHNPEIGRLATLLRPLCGRYHAAREADGIARLYPAELAQVRGTLHQAEHELARLHALAAAAEAMLRDAYPAFGLDAPGRPYRVVGDFDRPPDDDDAPASAPHRRTPAEV